VPADIDGNPNCLSLAGPNPITTVQCGVGSGNQIPGSNGNGGGQATVDGQFCTGYGPDPVGTDPRVFNLYSYRQTGICLSTDPATHECNGWSGTWVMATDDSAGAPTATTKRPLFGGAFFKIHTSQDMMIPNAASYDATGKSSTLCHQGGATPTQVACPTICTQSDMNDQIGCLVQASPCSLGYARRPLASFFQHYGGSGGAGTGLAVTTVDERLIGAPDSVACIQNLANAGVAGESYYPFTQKQYLNSIIGFGSVSPAELALASCENQAALVNQAVAANGFIPLPTFLAGGNPFCEDFNEQMLCPGYPYPGDPDGGQRNACADTANVQLGNGFQTTCGNGIVEPFEECDLGTLGVTAQGQPILPTDGGLVNGQTTLIGGGFVAASRSCSALCRSPFRIPPLLNASESRSGFAVALLRQFNLPPPSIVATFADLPPTDSRYPSAEAVYPYLLRSTLCPGCQLSSNFGANQFITRAQASVALVNVLALRQGLQVLSAAQADAVLAASPDAATIPLLARPYVATAIQIGILPLQAGGTVAATSPFAHAELAAALQTIETMFNLPVVPL
jgi:hypothetical protein